MIVPENNIWITWYEITGYNYEYMFIYIFGCNKIDANKDMIKGTVERSISEILEGRNEKRELL